LAVVLAADEVPYAFIVRVAVSVVSEARLLNGTAIPFVVQGMAAGVPKSCCLHLLVIFESRDTSQSKSQGT